jgi:hypothetical protein
MLDVRTGERVQDAVVIIEGNRIARVGRSTTLRIPPRARVIDATGRWILPGFFDMHVHGTARPEVPLELYLANGVTSVRDLGGNLAALRLTRDQLQTGGRQGPRVFFVGPLLDGNPPVWPAMSIIVDTPSQAESTVRFLADQGADAIKIYNRMSEPVLEAVIHVARRHRLPVVGHIPQAITVGRAVTIGMDVIEHTPIRSRDLVAWGRLTSAESDQLASESVTRREALVWQRVDLGDDEISTLISTLAASRIVLDPTLSVDEWPLLLQDEAGARQHPNNRFLPRAFVDEALGPEHDLFRTPAQLEAVAAAGVEKRRRFIGMCSRAGVQIIAGTDGPGIAELAPGFGLHHELALLVLAGLSPLDAIRAATVRAAQALHKDDVLGTIEEGKLADLVILDADPLLNIRNTSRISDVVLDGRLHQRAMLDTMLRQVEERTHIQR